MLLNSQSEPIEHCRSLFSAFFRFIGTISAFVGTLPHFIGTISAFIGTLFRFIGTISVFM
ncbi:hypothetical protein [Lysinibacillus sp. RS5]|uniref:hypothetical protein n=1 Tax=unclassified Lysinibacillus TaxID=2636778 RepID=UPI0035BE3247